MHLYSLLSLLLLCNLVLFKSDEDAGFFLLEKEEMKKEVIDKDMIMPHNISTKQIFVDLIK